MPATQSAFEQIKQGVGSFLGNLDKEFQNYTQPARDLANQGGLIGKLRQPTAPPISLQNIKTSARSILSTPISDQSLIGKLNQALTQTNQVIYNIPGVKLLSDTATHAGQNSLDLFRSASQQSKTNTPSRIPFTNINVPAPIAATAKLGLGALNLTPLSMAGNLVYEGVKQGAQQAPGLKGTPYPELLGIGASLFTPGGAGTKLSKLEQTVAKGKLNVLPKVEEAVLQLSKDLQGAKPRYGYGSNLFKLNFQSDVDKSLYIVAQSKPSSRDADYLKYLQGIFPEMSVTEIRQMGQKFRNTVIKPLAANGEGDILDIPSFSNPIRKPLTADIIPPTPETPVNPNPTSPTAWEQSLSEPTPPAPEPIEPISVPPVKPVESVLQQVPTPKEPVPGFDFAGGEPPITLPQNPAGEGKAGIGSIKQAFADWVNARRATRVEGYIKSKDFQDLDAEGLNGIFKFQAGETQGLYGKVKEFFDTKYNELRDAGLNFNYKENYLPQLWNNTSEEIAAVFGRRLGLKPSFAMNSIIKDYETGIAAGLTPKFQNISQLAGWYEGRANRALADLGFFKTLGNEGVLLPKGKAPFGWTTLDPDRFPKIQVTKGQKEYSGTFAAPKPIADMVNNYLRDPQFETLTKIANFVSAAKNRTLSFGIPFTAINMHGINILARHTLFGTGSNPIGRLLTAGKYLFNQKSASNYLDKILTTAPKAMRKGLTVGVEDFQGIFENPETTGMFSKLGKTWNTAFEKPLFDKMIPALKISSWQNLANDLAKKMPRDVAEKEAAKIVNNVYGGINWEAMGRNRDLQNLFRSVILAPDWAETTLRLGGNLAKSLVTGGPIAGRYRTMVTTLVGSYITANISNKLSSGHYMYENDPGHTFEIEVGYTNDGQKRYLRPYGTAADFVRLPYDTILSLAKGDPSPIVKTFTNRLSVPLAALGHVIFNVDYRGNPIYGKTKYGQDMPFLSSAANLGGEAISGLGFPAFAKQALQTGSGQQGLEQGLLQGFELPVRYSGGAYSNSQKTAKGVAQAGGASGEDLYKINKAMQGITLSKNQEALLQQEGIGILPDILQLKDQNHTLNQIKTIQENIVGGTVTEEEGNKQIEELINHLEESKKQTDAGASAPNGLVKTADASSGFPVASIVGGPVYSNNSLVGTAMAADNKSVIQNKLAEQLARAKVQTTGKPQEANGSYFYTNEKGSVVSIPLDRPIYQPKLSGNPTLDKMELQDQATSYTAKINDIQALYKVGKYTAAEAIAKIDELKNQKASAGGGTVKKAKKLKLPKLKISKPKTTKTRVLKFSPLRINTGNLGSKSTKIKSPGFLRTTPLTLKKLNLKFKQNLPPSLKLSKRSGRLK